MFPFESTGRQRRIKQKCKQIPSGWWNASVWSLNKFSISFRLPSRNPKIPPLGDWIVRFSAKFLIGRQQSHFYALFMEKEQRPTRKAKKNNLSCEWSDVQKGPLLIYPQPVARGPPSGDIYTSNQSCCRSAIRLPPPCGHQAVTRFSKGVIFTWLTDHLHLWPHLFAFQKNWVAAWNLEDSADASPPRSGSCICDGSTMTKNCDGVSIWHKTNHLPALKMND